MASSTLALPEKDVLPEALLFRRIATVETDAPVSESVDELEFLGKS